MIVWHVDSSGFYFVLCFFFSKPKQVVRGKEKKIFSGASNQRLWPCILLKRRRAVMLSSVVFRFS